MFRSVLMTQWKWVRLPLLVATIAAFAIPVLSVKSVREIGLWEAAVLMDTMTSWAIFYPILAAGLGLLLALTTWGTDHRLEHVYALSLPVTRFHFTALRLAGGAVLLAAPAAAMVVGSGFATLTASIPDGMTAYPLALSFRFTLASLLSFVVFFAISAGSNRTAGFVLSLMVALVLGDWLGSGMGADMNILENVLSKSFNWPSPLQLFSGRWMLIDI